MILIYWPNTWPQNYNTFEIFRTVFIWMLCRLPREKHFEPVVRDPGGLTVLASESLWCHRVVQTLRASETLAWCKFCGVQLPKALRTCSVVICFKNRFRATTWCKNLATSWAAGLSHPPVFRSWLCEPAKPQNYMEKHCISCTTYPRKPPHLTHLFVHRPWAATFSTCSVLVQYL